MSWTVVAEAAVALKLVGVLGIVPMAAISVAERTRL